jgi:hypothetical protein
MARYGLKRITFAFGFAALFLGGTTIANAQAFGALALSPKGAWGYSSSFATVDEAQDRALAECNKHDKGCNVVRVFDNICVAIARNEIRERPIITWVSGRSQQERTRLALRNCRSDGGTDCKILKEFCTGDARD